MILIYTFIAYYVAFGPHGPRAPANPPGTTLKIILGTGGLIAAAGALYIAVRVNGAYRLFPLSPLGRSEYRTFHVVLLLAAPAPPSTLTKEWQEASNELALAAKMNPITGGFLLLNILIKIGWLTRRNPTRYFIGRVQGQRLCPIQIVTCLQKEFVFFLLHNPAYAYRRNGLFNPPPTQTHTRMQLHCPRGFTGFPFLSIPC